MKDGPRPAQSTVLTHQAVSAVRKTPAELRVYPVVCLSRFQAGEGQLPIIATATWSISKKVADRFAPEGSGLTRYASVFSSVEINSTFYRRHKPATFARWADAVPDGFQFSVKMPKEMTHTRAMTDIARPFETFLEDIASLKEKRGPLLCQLPPSLAFNATLFETAFKAIRDCDTGPIVIEVRHKSWTSVEALDLLRTYDVDRVLADPAQVWPAEDFITPPRYVRLHGKPRSTIPAIPTTRSCRFQNCWHRIAGAYSTIRPLVPRSRTHSRCSTCSPRNNKAGASARRELAVPYVSVAIAVIRRNAGKPQAMLVNDKSNFSPSAA